MVWLSIDINDIRVNSFPRVSEVCKLMTNVGF